MKDTGYRNTERKDWQRLLPTEGLFIFKNAFNTKSRARLNIQISNLKKKKEKKHKHRIQKHRKKRMAKVVANRGALHLQSCYKYKIRCNVQIVKYRCETDKYTNIKYKTDKHTKRNTKRKDWQRLSPTERSSPSSKLPKGGGHTYQKSPAHPPIL